MIRFKEQLNQQLDFIANSCDSYDRGQNTEAIRIGTSLRVLFHNTKNSTSLLKHLGVEQVEILSTCQIRQSIPEGLAFDGLVGLSRTGPQPKLGQSQTLIKLPAADWWQQPVLGSNSGFVLSHKDIALTAANKDGGTHVDLKLPRDYEKLVEGLWVNSFGGGRYINHHFLSLRQMGYEILNSPKLLAIAAYNVQTLPLKEAVPAHKRILIESFEASSLSQEESKKILAEGAAWKSPILVPCDETYYSSPCPFCEKKSPKDSSPNPPPIIEGELPLPDEQKWIYCQGDPSHLLLIQRMPIEPIGPIKGQNAYDKIISKLRGNSLAERLAEEVFNFYGEFLIYSESRETLNNTYTFDIRKEPNLFFSAVRILLKFDTGQEAEDLAHALLYVQLPILGFPAIDIVDMPDGMNEKSVKVLMGSYRKIQNLIYNEIIIRKFKALGYHQHRFLGGFNPPPNNYQAKAIHTSPQDNDWQSSFSWWCLEYFGYWIGSRHGQSLKVQRNAIEILKWGSELHPTLKEAAGRMREWVMLGEFKKPEQYIPQVNNLLEIMKFPKVIGWILLENSTSQQPTAKRI